MARTSSVRSLVQMRMIRRLTAVFGVMVLMPVGLAQAYPAPQSGHGLGAKSAQGPATQAARSVPGASFTGTGKKTYTPSAAEAAKDYHAPKVTWPTGSATVALTSAGVRTSAGHQVVQPGAAHRAGALPVTMAAADATAGAAKSATVSFASRAAATAAGINGVIFTVGRADGGKAASPTRVSLDYNGFADAYGGGYGGRLALVELPACALTTPKVAECRVQRQIGSSNDPKAGTVSATVPVGTAGNADSALVLAAQATPASSVGTYAATTLSPAGTWSSGGSSGAFTYSYPIAMPSSTGGTAPDVTLSYDSSSVDGRTAATNAQASWIGDGWDYSPGYIERSYQPCSQDGISDSSDLCWGGDLLSMSLSGHSGALVLDSDDTWKLQNDDGTKVIPLSGANNGAWQGEAWEIVTPDGTQYYFGENHLPGGSGSDAATQSAWTEPIYCPKANDGPQYLSGKPSCNSSSTGTDSFVANMAWRWNLDYVVDPHGNLQTYTWAPETNYYQRGYDGGANAGTSTLYTRGGYLQSISYGSRLPAAITGSQPLDKVTFNVGERCAPGWTSNCNYTYLTQNLTDPSTTENWPDTPADQICPTQSFACTTYTPTFFETDELQSIVTSVYAGSAWSNVDTYTLSQMFPAPQNGTTPDPLDPIKDEICSTTCGDDTVAVMWLLSIQHQGDDTLGGGSAASTPATTFLWDMLPNRVGAPQSGVGLYRPRMDSITTESGSQIVVSYYINSSQNCTSSTLPSSPDEDTMYCFAQYWTQVGGSESKLDWFNIYPVQAVTINDLVAPAGWSENQTTSYSYTGAAWHRDDNPLTPDKQRTWNQFHGFRTVTTTAGTAGSEDVPTQTVTIYMQGMNGDYLSDGTQRSVSVPDNVGDTVTDSHWLQGQVLESDTLLGLNGAWQKRSVNGPWTYTTTATESMADSMPSLVAEMLQSSKTRSFQLWHDGTTKTLETDVAYDADGREVSSDAKGDGTSAVPEVCTTTSYASSSSSVPNMLAYPDEVKAVQGACGTTATAANTISDKLTFYDGSATLGALTGPGDPTESEDVDSYDSSGVPVYVPESTDTYDAYGRTLSTKDADSNSTSTAYSTPGASPDTETVTNPMGWNTVTTLDPARDLPIAVQDVNNETTSRTYNGLGQVTAVWSPLHSKAQSQPADETYSYAESNSIPSTVTTNTLREDGIYASTVNFYDGSLRLVQTQAPTTSGAAGRLITDAHYNSLGQTVKTTDAYYDATSSPSSSIFNPYGTGDNDSNIPLETRTSYDGLGRAVAAATYAQGVYQYSTTTAYKGVDETDTTPPKGGTATSGFVDAAGRSIASWTYKTASPTGNAADATVTSYTYTSAGKPATMSDAATNTWTWSYDLHGNEVKAVDPGTDTTLTTYDGDGNVRSTTDARGITLNYSYDKLNRKTFEYNATGGTSVLLAAWTYDTIEKGEPTASIRYTNGAGDTTQTYTETVRGYTPLYQSKGVQVTIPSSEGNLAGTYQDYQSYTSETSLLTQDYYYADQSGLPQQTVNINRNLAGLVIGLSGVLNTVSYNPWGRVLQTNFGASGEQYDQTDTYDQDTGRLLSDTSSVQVSSGSSTMNPIDYTSYTYNQAGNITAESNQQAGTAVPDTQCFTYDNQDRLTAAYTDTAALISSTGTGTSQIAGIGGCTDNTATAAKIAGGPAPYAQTYAYDSLGDRVSEQQLNTSTAAVTSTQSLAYNGYNAATGASSKAGHPDAVTSTKTSTAAGTLTDAYSYAVGGGMVSGRTFTPTGSTTAPANQSIAYDPEGRTQSVKETSGSTSTTSSYVYAADGSLLVQHDQADNTNILYLPFGEEVYLSTGNGKLSGNRYIDSPDGTTVVLSSSGSASYEASDTLGTATVAINAATLAVTNRYFDPFGNARGTAPSAWPDQHAFLGQPEDPSTGLDLLGARQYDPSTGRFLSVDPVLESGDQRQMNGYSYAADNPVNESDPSGAIPYCGPGCEPGGTSTTDEDTYEDQYNCGKAGGTWSNGQCDMPDPGSVTLVASLKGSDDKSVPELYAPTNAPWLNQFIQQFHHDDGCNSGIGCLDATPYSIFLAAYSACRQIPACAASGYYNYLKTAWGSSATSLAGIAAALGDGKTPGQSSGADEIIADLGADNLAAADSDIEKNAEDAIDAAMCPTSGGQSFTAGTLVLLADGQEVPISLLHVGVKVVAADTSTGKNEVETVDAVLVHHDSNLYDLAVKAGQATRVIHTTANHLIWDATARTWIEAAQLPKGDRVLTEDGSTVTADGGTTPADDQGWMWDLTVDTLHTFYVLAGSVAVLVHNSDCGPMVLGIQQHSEALAGQLDGAYTFNGPDYAQVVGQVGGKPYAQWQASVSAVLRNNGKVAISLGGFDGATPAEQFMNAYKAGGGEDWTATQWEMQQVGRQVRLGNLDWSNVSFYDGAGNPVSIPEPQW